MRLHALLLAGALALGNVSEASAAPFVPQGDEGAATTEAAPEAGDAATTEAAADAAPAAADDSWKLDPEKIDKLIEKYNIAQGGEPRVFTAEERDYIARGVAPRFVDDVDKGYVYLKTANPNAFEYYRDGQVFTVESGGDFNSPPVATHTGPFTSEVDNGTFWTARSASETADEVDAMFQFIMWTCYIFSALIGVLMVLFVFKYRRRPGVKADQSITHNTPLEIFWSVVPTILVAIMFWGGYTTFLDMRTPPPDAMKINVTAYQWGWKYQYANGTESPQEFHVPANTPIEMQMTSTDVIHSFGLPAFRIKSDVLPDRYTSVWFDSGEPGVYTVYCTEYCGQSHANMYTLLVVEPREQYEQWLADVGNVYEDLPPLEVGTLAYEREGCKTCHSLDGSRIIGPSFKGLWGKQRTFDAGLSKDATPTVADANYIRRSILRPHEQIVEGYGAQMSDYSGMKPNVITGLIAFIESLGDE